MEFSKVLEKRRKKPCKYEKAEKLGKLPPAL